MNCIRILWWETAEQAGTDQESNKEEDRTDVEGGPWACEVSSCVHTKASVQSKKKKKVYINKKLQSFVGGCRSKMIRESIL